MNEIKKRIYYDKRASELFSTKSEFILNNKYLGYEQITKEDFFEYIFGSAQNDDPNCFLLPFDDEKSKEYLDWKKQRKELIDKERKEIVYQPDQNFKYNVILLGLYDGFARGGGEKIIKGRPYIMTNGLEYLDKALEEYNDALITSPITYIGNNRTSKNSRYLYAMAFDLDGVGMDQLRDLLYQMQGNVLPTANIIVNSGNGLHLYYILKKPVALFQNAKEVLGRLKRALTTKLWNNYTSTIEKPQYQGIFQGFRIPGSRTKRGEVIPAFLNREAPLYTIEDLAKRVNFDPKKPVVSQSEWEMLDTGKYTTNRLTLRKAKELYPEWYERVIVKGDNTKNRWHVSRDLYDWWLRTIKDPTSDVTTGHRYFCLLALSMFAIKCDVPKEELKKDLLSMVEPFDRLTDSDDNPFTEDDAMDAYQAYQDDYCTFPRNSIEYLTGIRIKKNKRNGRDTKSHLERARAVQEIDYPNGSWRNTEGRPIATPENSEHYALVQEWRQNNPNSTNKSLCSREVGVDRKTVRKWWNEQ